MALSSLKLRHVKSKGIVKPKGMVPKLVSKPELTIVARLRGQA